MQLVFTLVYVTNWIFGCFPPQGLFILLCKSLHQISIKRGKNSLHKQKLQDCCHNSPQFSSGSFYYQRLWIIFSTLPIPNNTILQHHCLLCFMVKCRWERRNIQMKHYLLPVYGIHSGAEGFISRPRIWEQREISVCCKSIKLAVLK